MVQTLQLNGIIAKERPVFTEPIDNGTRGRNSSGMSLTASDAERLSDDFNMGVLNSLRGSGESGGMGMLGRSSGKSDDFDIRLSDIGRLSDDFLGEAMGGLQAQAAVEGRMSGGMGQGKKNVDQQALSALNANRVRRTSSDAVFAMLNGESIDPNTAMMPPPASPSKVALERTSSDALMTFLDDVDV